MSKSTVICYLIINVTFMEKTAEAVTAKTAMLLQF